MLLGGVVLAAADVYQQSKLQRYLRTQLEICDFLRDAIFHELEIVLPEVGNQRAMFVSNGGGYVHQLHVHANSRLSRANG